MGVLMIVLSLATAGVVADYIAENDLLTAANQTITLFGTKLTVSGVAPAVGAFVLGAAAVVLFVIGVGLLRGSWGRRRALKKRIADLEWQITELRSRERLSEVVKAEHERHLVELPETEEINLSG